MNKKGIGKGMGIVIVILLVVVIIVGVIIAVNLSKPNSPSLTGEVPKQQNFKESNYYTQKYTTAFTPLWRNTNWDCNSYRIDRENEDCLSNKIKLNCPYERGELSFALNIDNKEDTKKPLDKPMYCEVTINNKPSYKINLDTEVRISDNAYLGSGNVFEEQNIKICCGSDCVTHRIKSLC